MSQLEIEAAAFDMVEQRGRVVMDKVEQKLLTTSYDNGIIASALQYYAKSNLPLVLPLFPALISLSYEVVAGSQETGGFESVATAMMLIALSADIHDDIIDQSTVKYAKKTIYGKFGSEIALLAGDALLIQGHALLHQACEAFSPKQRQELSVLIPKALFELSAAEVLERQLSKKSVIEPEEYFEIIRLKGVFAELQCRIGGIIGRADDETLEAIAIYGRTVGLLGTIKDEFSDVTNIPELTHRMQYECPPLPVVYAIRNEEVKMLVDEFVKQLTSKVAVKKFAAIVLESEGVCDLKHKISEQVTQKLKDWILTRKNRAGHDAALLLQAFSS